MYRGPTQVVVDEQPGLFERIAVAFALPGEDAAARLGPPDVIFFALFLAAARTFDLRVAATWLGMTAGLPDARATYAFDLGGLPGLPAIALGFLVPNVDLLWRALRARASARARRAAHGTAPPCPRRDQQLAFTQASMFWRSPPHLGGVQRLRDLLELRHRPRGWGLAARQADVLQLVRELLEVLGEHLYRP